MVPLQQVDQLTSILEVERNVINAFAGLVVKLSEASFRPIFLKVSVLTADQGAILATVPLYTVAGLVLSLRLTSQATNHILPCCSLTGCL